MKRSASKASAAKPAEVLAAAGAADLARLKELVARGGDVNASWRN